MKKRIRRAAVLLLCAVMLFAACGGQGTGAPVPDSGSASIPAPDSGPAGAPEPDSEKSSYTGPLYEVETVRLADSLPGYRGFAFYQDGEGENPDGAYTKKILQSGEVSYHGLLGYFMDGDSRGRMGYANRSLADVGGALGDDYRLLSYADGVFQFQYWPPDETGATPYRFFDADGTMLYEMPAGERFGFESGAGLPWSGDGCMPMWFNDGLITYYNETADEYGLLNVRTGEKTPLGPEYAFGIIQYPNLYSEEAGGIFSEGLCPVQYRDITARSHARYHTDAGTITIYESDFAGFLDEEGNFAIRFSELPAFDGLKVISATGFFGGECILGTRPIGADGKADESGDIGCFVIDRTGAVLRESDRKEYRAKLDDMEQYDEANGAGWWVSRFTPWERLRIADGLLLEAEDNAFRLTDANGTEYPLSCPEPYNNMIVYDNGIVTFYYDDPERAASEYPGEKEYEQYALKLTWIAPEDYAVPEDFCPDVPSAADHAPVTYYNLGEVLTEAAGNAAADLAKNGNTVVRGEDWEDEVWCRGDARQVREGLAEYLRYLSALCLPGTEIVAECHGGRFSSGLEFWIMTPLTEEDLFSFWDAPYRNSGEVEAMYEECGIEAAYPHGLRAEALLEGKGISCGVLHGINYGTAGYGAPEGQMIFYVEGKRAYTAAERARTE